ncbi:MAG: PqqD family protein [Erysipelotrichaceae bacterium]|nr:PqqD family protein [Erysipelotrichaceae bacterium]
MHLKEGFIVRNVADEYLLIPTGKNIASFGGSVILNEVSAFILNQMKADTTKEQLLEAILTEYDVSLELATQDLDKLLTKLTQLGIIE